MFLPRRATGKRLAVSLLLALVVSGALASSAVAGDKDKLKAKTRVTVRDVIVPGYNDGIQAQREYVDPGGGSGWSGCREVTNSREIGESGHAVNLQTTWCANGGPLTYLNCIRWWDTTTPSPAEVGWLDDIQVSGGVGFDQGTCYTQGYIRFQTPFGTNVNRYPWLENRVYRDGNYGTSQDG